MGYELSIASDMSIDSSDAWFLCGYDKSTLFTKFCMLGERVVDSYDNVGAKVSLDELLFIESLDEHLQDNPLWQRYRRVYDADTMLADEWYDKVDVDTRVDMALVFFEDDAIADKYRGILHELYRYTVDYPWFVHGLAQHIADWRSRDIEYVYVFGG